MNTPTQALYSSNIGEEEFRDLRLLRVFGEFATALPRNAVRNAWQTVVL
jgi:hypothetical protein